MTENIRNIINSFDIEELVEEHAKDIIAEIIEDNLRDIVEETISESAVLTELREIVIDLIAY